MWNSLVTWLDSHQYIIGWALGVSVLTFIGTLIAVPVAIVAMRPDFFVRDKRQPLTLSPIRLAARLAKNTLGMVLLFMGFLMLFMPGQGLLTTLLGLSLIEFPGKRRLELRLIRMRAVHRSIDWIRRRAGKEPVQVPEKD